MRIYQKQIMNFKHIRFIVLVSILLTFYLSGCMKDKTSVGVETEKDKVNVNTSIQEQNMKTESDMWKSIGARIRELDMVPEIDEVAILVDGYSITKKEFETQKIYSEILRNATIKESTEALIRAKAIEAEAIRMNIYPSKEKIEVYLRQVDESLKNRVNGTETIFAYMEGMGITQKEYLSMLEKSAYAMYQREALWASVESLQKDKDYEQYVDEVVNNAKIEFIEPEVKKLFTQ